MAPDFVASVGGPSGVTELVQRGRQLGQPSGPLDEAVYREAGTISYYLIGRFETMPSATIQWVWDTAGVIQGMLVRPTPESAPSKFADRETRTPLRLPFEGPAYVAWGGRLPHQNYHVQNIQQRFAYDFFLLEDGKIRQGRGERNTDYACWGRPILAPAPGKVRVVVDTVGDNRPGRLNPAAAPGNLVTIEHGRGEVSLLAHLREGSVLVRPGDDVEAGQPVGACGNSGNSSAPHLHYHLQSHVRPDRGAGLPARFRHYLANGRDIEAGEPVRGQTVATREEASRLPAGSR
jgi:murein DD-endopeptidase MepM/ murein hydrolase activator NlpD